MPNSFHTENEFPQAPRRVWGGIWLRRSSAVWLLSVFGATGCLFQHKAKPVAYTPPPPHPPAKPAPQPNLPLPPELEQNLAIIMLPDSTEVFPSLPAPPAPVKPKPPLIAGPKPPANPAPDTPTPRLGQIFTPEEIRTLTNDLNTSLIRANDALGKIERRRLKKEDV